MPAFISGISCFKPASRSDSSPVVLLPATARARKLDYLYTVTSLQVLWISARPFVDNISDWGQAVVVDSALIAESEGVLEWHLVRNGENQYLFVRIDERGTGD